jgi:glycine oxidase
MTAEGERPVVTVAGAGIFGLCAALLVQRRGVRVLLIDPSPGIANASSVAAGLLAPIGEVLFDPSAAPHASLLNAGMDRWPDFAADFGVDLVSADLIVTEQALQNAKQLGVRVRQRNGKAVIEGDARIGDPPAALSSLRRVFEKAGGRVENRALGQVDAAGDSLLVIAAGPGVRGLTHIAPELAHLTPVKGQIAVLPQGPETGPTLRWPGGYLAPQCGGARLGATMEEGVTDTFVDRAVIASLVEGAKGHVPDLDATGVYGQAGVRMQTPDALPMVGPSILRGNFLAVGARRNGWLLGPLVGEMIAAYVMGEDPGPWAATLHPARFD